MKTTAEELPNLTNEHQSQIRVDRNLRRYFKNTMITALPLFYALGRVYLVKRDCEEVFFDDQEVVFNDGHLTEKALIAIISAIVFAAKFFPFKTELNASIVSEDNHFGKIGKALLLLAGTFPAANEASFLLPYIKDENHPATNFFIGTSLAATLAMFTLIHGHELEEFAKNLQGVICQFSALDIIPAIIGPAEIMFCLLAASQNYQAIIENDNITRAFAGIGGLLEIGMVFNSIRSTTDLIYNKIKGSQETPYQEHQEEQSPINQESQLTKNTTCAAIICSSLIDAFTTACVSYKEGIKIPFWNVKPHNLVVATIGGLLNFMVHTAEGLYCDSNHQDEKPGNAITEACADVLKVRAL